MPSTGCRRRYEKPDVTRGSNLSGEARKKRFSDSPGGVVVGRLPAGRLKAERAEQPSGVGEPRRDDVAVADARPVPQHLLEDDFDDVAGLQVAVEVDVAAEQLGDPDRQADVLAGPLERGDERRVIAIDVAADRDQRRPRDGRSRSRW